MVKVEEYLGAKLRNYRPKGEDTGRGTAQVQVQAQLQLKVNVKVKVKVLVMVNGQKHIFSTLYFRNIYILFFFHVFLFI